MPSPPVLEIDALLTPIPGEDPAGSVPHVERAELDEARKFKHDPDQPDRPVPPNWADIVLRAREVLRSRSKDLVVATRLVEALFQQHGFAGLPDGFRLLRRLVAECWDRLKPPADDDGDLSARANALGWLMTPEQRACFPANLRIRPLFPGEDRAYSYQDWKRAQEGKGGVKREDVEQAIANLSYEDCLRLAEDMARGLEELDQLTRALKERMGEQAPETEELRQALRDCHQLVQRCLRDKKPPEPAPAEGPATPANGAAAAQRAVPTRAPSSRDDVYDQLAQAAAVLRRLEPHSPIPYLIDRAVALGRMPFPQMIRELIREENTLSELRRELGIKEADDNR